MALAAHDKNGYQRLLETIEAQKRIINDQRNELQWFQDIIFNPALNEVDIRSLVTVTPPEVRRGYGTEQPEKKLFIPAIEEKIHASGKTFVKRMKRLEQSGAVKYSYRPDENGNNRSYLQVLPAIERPAQIQLDKAERGGGSEYENGKRVKRCRCGSADLILVKKSHIVCNSCGEEQPGSRKESMTPVNPPENFPPDPDSEACGHGDMRDFEQEETAETEEPEPENEACGHGDMRDAASDTEGQKASGHGDCRTSDLDSTPDIKACGHGDMRDSAESEILKLPHITESTVGVSEELSNVPAELLNTPPAELRKRRQWVVWRYEPNPDRGKPKKAPRGAFGKCTHIDHTDPKNWRTYEEAMRFYNESHANGGWKEPLDGIGFALGNGVVGVDIDHCIVDGQLSDLAADVMNTIASYSELSPSGSGVHILALGKWPGEWKKRGDLEVYAEKHYFTFTGSHIAGTPESLEECTEHLAAVHAKYASAEKAVSPTGNEGSDHQQAPPCGHTSSTHTPMSGDEILLRARNAANGAKFTLLYDEGDITGYASPSNADLALCNLLAYWTDDADMIDALFRKSALYREEKWDRAARIGETYGEGTIRVALEARNAA